MDTDQRIPVTLAGVPTQDYAKVIGAALLEKGERDLALNLMAARNPEEVLRAVSEKVHFIWEREPPAEKEVTA